jgi:hypothetical protein
MTDTRETRDLERRVGNIESKIGNGVGGVFVRNDVYARDFRQVTEDIREIKNTAEREAETRAVDKRQIMITLIVIAGGTMTQFLFWLLERLQDVPK